MDQLQGREQPYGLARSDSAQNPKKKEKKEFTKSSFDVQVKEHQVEEKDKKKNVDPNRRLRRRGRIAPAWTENRTQILGSPVSGEWGYTSCARSYPLNMRPMF